jgi:hypothetical protein
LLGAIHLEAWRARRVWLVVIGYLALTSWLSLELNVWRDEMYSLYSSAGSPSFAFRQALDFELQPPLYFVLLSVWRTLDSSVFFARLLSGLFGAGAILAAAALSARVLRKIDPVWTALVVGTHPLVVWAGTEIRVYALIVLLSVLLTLAFFDAYWVSGDRRRGRLLFGGLALLCVYTQYYLAALLACFGIALLLRRNRPSIERYSVDLAAVGVLSVPLLITLRAQLASHHEDFGPPLRLGSEALHLVFTRFESYIFSFNKAIDESRWSLGAIRAARWAYRAAVLAVIVGPAWVLRHRIDRRSLARRWPLFAVVAAYAACMLFLLHLSGPLSVGERHTAAIVVPALVAALAAATYALGRPVALIATSFLVTSNVAATLLTQVVPLAKDCDCKRVAVALGERQAAGEPILVFPSEDALPLAVYYRGPNPLVPVPRPVSFDHWDQRTFVIDDTHEIADLLGRGDPRGLWVHTNTYGTSWGEEKLEQFLAQDYRVDEELDFFKGVRLRHFVPNGVAHR